MRGVAKIGVALIVARNKLVVDILLLHYFNTSTQLVAINSSP